MSLTKLYEKFEALSVGSPNRVFTLPEIKQTVDEEIKIIMAEKEKNSKNGKFPFGKYKSKLVKDVAEFDKPYLTWIMTQPFFSKFVDTKAEVEKYL